MKEIMIGKNGRRGRYVGFGKNRKYLGKGKPSIFDGAEKTLTDCLLLPVQHKKLLT